ncbi:MazG family protein [Thermospira aquatica]|uniref:MazG family protein n=1 Tax=Thermospira aquatica TaxID=2828656 RepID=A0AAX3BGF5_9SPIR|nr:MazG family protein [Thermospira aquatica]URA10516.1 MazG family protein [Thermospira aquatica]
MEAFQKLLRIIETLRSPEGCPWDREQTIPSMRTAIIEEAYELVEAIDTQDKENLKEEMGDLFFVVCFVAYLAQQENLFTIEEMIESVTSKLIRRHPHVFHEKNTITVENVLQNWEAIKSREKSTPHHPLKSIPKNLPELQRLYKILNKMKRLKVSWKLESLQTISHEISRAAHHDPKNFLKGFLLYAFEQGLDVPAIIRELSHELITHFDKQTS